MSEITKYSNLSTLEFIQVTEDYARQCHSTQSILTEATQRLQTLETFEDLRDLRLSAETVAVSRLEEVLFEDMGSRRKAAAAVISEFLEAVGFEEVVEAWRSALSCV